MTGYQLKDLNAKTAREMAQVSKLDVIKKSYEKAKADYEEAKKHHDEDQELI